MTMNKFIITGLGLFSGLFFVLGWILSFMFAGITDGAIHEDKWRRNLIHKVHQEVQDEG